MLITSKCNFFCRICSWRNKNSDNKKELDIDDIQEFISQIKIYHPLIHIGGGEPFMRQDLLDIITIIKRSNLKCLITTNGFLLNEDIIEKILRLKIDALIFSLYGWDRLHDEITGVENSFERIIMNLKTVLDKRRQYTKVFVSTVPLPSNVNSLKQLVRNLYSLGIDGVKIEQLNFLTFEENNCYCDSKDRFCFSPSTFIRDDYFDQRFIDDLIEVYKNICKTYGDFIFIKPYLNKIQLINWYSTIPYRFPKCFFIAHSVFINYNGDIIPCQFFPHCVLGNIKQDSLESVWLSVSYRRLRESIKNIRPIICKRCCKN